MSGRTWRDDYADQNLRMAQKMLEQQGEVNAARAELEAQRQRYAELVRAATALCTHGPLGVLALARDPLAGMKHAEERDARWLALRAALAELASPCICSDLDVSNFATRPGERVVLRGLEPTCPEHGKGTRRVDPLG